MTRSRRRVGPCFSRNTRSLQKLEYKHFTITQAMTKIRDGKLYLPAIHRKFVWAHHVAPCGDPRSQQTITLARDQVTGAKNSNWKESFRLINLKPTGRSDS
jgi:hypothetical protein